MATLYPEPEDKEMWIRSQIYSVEYDELINQTYNWPEQDMKHGIIIDSFIKSHLGFPTPLVRRDSMDD